MPSGGLFETKTSFAILSFIIIMIWLLFHLHLKTCLFI
jgi:hypothetical protein